MGRIETMESDIIKKSESLYTRPNLLFLNLKLTIFVMFCLPFVYPCVLHYKGYHILIPSFREIK